MHTLHILMCMRTGVRKPHNSSRRLSYWHMTPFLNSVTFHSLQDITIVCRTVHNDEPEGKAANLDTYVAKCLYIRMSVLVSYGCLACGLEIASVAIHTASSCPTSAQVVLGFSIQAVSNCSLQLRLLVWRPIVAGQWHHFYPCPCHNPSIQWRCCTIWCRLLKSREKWLGVGKTHLSSEIPWILTASIGSPQAHQHGHVLLT